MGTYILLLSLVGSIASIVSVLIAKTNSKFVHITYAVLLTILAGGSTLMLGNVEKKLEIAKIKASFYESMSEEANNILKTYPNNLYDVGGNRGFILTSFSFLEKSKDRFPETYILAKELVSNGLKIAESVSEEKLQDVWDERKRMDDGAKAMKSMLEGIKKNIPNK